jgi:hypothetical protein
VRGDGLPQLLEEAWREIARARATVDDSAREETVPGDIDLIMPSRTRRDS